MRKYDTGGTEIWTRQFGTTSEFNLTLDDFALGVAADASGVYVAGSTAYFFPGQDPAAVA